MDPVEIDNWGTRDEDKHQEQGGVKTNSVRSKDSWGYPSSFVPSGSLLATGRIQKHFVFLDKEGTKEEICKAQRGSQSVGCGALYPGPLDKRVRGHQAWQGIRVYHIHHEVVFSLARSMCCQLWAIFRYVDVCFACKF